MTSSPRIGDGRGGTTGGRRPSPLARLEHAGASVRQRYGDTTAGRVWGRVTALDLVDRAMQFAGVLLLGFFPFLIVVNALAGRSAVPGLVRRLGLDHEAAAHVGALFTSSVATASAVGGVGYVLFVLSGLAAAGELQGLYRRVFEVPPRGVVDVPLRLAWLGAAIAAGLTAGVGAPALRHGAGVVAAFAVGFVAVGAFWWFSAWLLLAARVPWRELLPTAVATGAFWTGMQLVFSHAASGMVASDYDKYGQIGVVFALMSWLIAIGVVILLGAVVGAAWRDRVPRAASP